jgi:DNA polymerase (family 10)
MKNFQLAKIFSEMAFLLEMKDIQFKPKAYQKAAQTIAVLSTDIEKIYQKNNLEQIPGVGEGIAEKIEEFIKTGKIQEYEKLKKQCPVDLENLTAVEGLGPKMIKVLFKKLGIKNLNDLEKKARAGKLRNLDGFGEKTEQNILKGIEFVRKSKGRFLLGFILPIIKEIEKNLSKLKEVEQISIAGSARRQKETIGDADILIASSSPKKIMDYFVKMPGAIKIWGKGKTKSSIRLNEGFDVDLRVVEKKSFGSALQYFTGSKEHNILLRRIAMEKKYKLNEYGLFQGEKRIANKTEKDIYKKLGLDYIEPELREANGEIEAAKNKTLPKLIGYNEIQGDLHCHTDWSDGKENILTMAIAAQKLGRKYLAITDHTGSLKIANGLDAEKLLRQKKEIDKINRRLKGIKILSGAEVNIKPNGLLDIDDWTLSKLDFVIAGVHSHFKMDKNKMTERILRAMRNKNVKVIVHPTGRIIQKREGYLLDLEKIFQEAIKTKTALEINSWPQRLDLNDENIRKAVRAGVKLSISTDAHSISHFYFLKFGIAQARRGWAERKNIINSLPLGKMMKIF